MPARSYPPELEETFSLRSGRRVLLRPIRPEDEPEHFELLHRMSPEDNHFRFFASIKSMTHDQMRRFTEIDYDHEMAIIASAAREDGAGNETLGVVRIAASDDYDWAEYAIVVRSDVKGQGLGRKLMHKIIDYSRTRRIKTIIGQILPENTAMLKLVRDLGFETRLNPDERVVEVRLTI